MNVKAIILAAGSGTRLKKYTEELPKGMLPVFGKSIIKYQIEAYRRNGVNDISIVSGFCHEKINFPGTKSYHNPDYATTNMVESLFCAAQEISGDLIISYADILFEDSLLHAVIHNTSNIGVVVDSDWKDYWLARYDKVDFDTESLSLAADGTIKELGTENPPLNTIDGRYVGMLRVSPRGAEMIKESYDTNKKIYSGKEWIGGRLFEKMYMTDFLQNLIDSGHAVFPINTNRGWLEFDTNQDYERVLEWEESNTLHRFYKRPK
jgi:choline kinase